jgi:hypothetical protein
MAEEIIGYLDKKLFDASKPAFFGCEDFLRVEAGESTTGEEFFTIIDDCVYTDANALAIVAYLDADALLTRPACKARALSILEFLWRYSWNEHDGMSHYYDGAARVTGLLIDQARMGTALVRAFRATGGAHFLERARGLADVILRNLAHSDGGYCDRGQSELAFFGAPLTLIDQNGIAASFFLLLADATKEARYRDAALRALNAYTEDFASWGIHGAPFGRALGEFLSPR